MANSNRRDDYDNGEQHLQQWHGVDLEGTTSSLAESLTAILLANSIRNNGMELARRHNVQPRSTARHHELGDNSKTKPNKNTYNNPRFFFMSNES